MSQPTDHAIERALIAVLKQKPFEKITVDDIANQAGIDRSTFYRYFHNKYEALSASMPILITPEMFAELDRMRPSSRLDSIIWWVADNRKLMRNLLVENQQFSSYQELVRVVTKILMNFDYAVTAADNGQPMPIVALIQNAPDPKRMVHFAAAMLVSVLTDYIGNDMEIKAEDVITDLHYLFEHLGLDERPGTFGNISPTDYLRKDRNND
jgi:AcrR family transcriptional regulator